MKIRTSASGEAVRLPVERPGTRLGVGLILCCGVLLAACDPPPPGSLKSVRTPDFSVDGLHPAVLERMTSFLIGRSDASIESLLALRDGPAAELRVSDPTFRGPTEADRTDFEEVEAERRLIILLAFYELERPFLNEADAAADPRLLERAPRLLGFVRAFAEANAQGPNATVDPLDPVGQNAERTLKTVQDYLARHQPRAPAPPKEAGSAGP